MDKIKFAFRKNHIYLVFLFFSYFLRRILLIIINKLFPLSNSLIYCYLMCLGEFLGGLTIFWYQSAFLRKRVKGSNSKNPIQLIETEREMNSIDNKCKVLFLLFLASYFDLIEVFITSDFIPSIVPLPSTSELRLCFSMTISSSLLCIFALKKKIEKHQYYSLIILGISSLVIIIFEFIYRPKEKDLGSYMLSYLLLVLHFIFRSYTDVIENYLGEYNFISAFKIIMLEGISNSIMLVIYSIFWNPMIKIKDLYLELNTGDQVLFIILLFLYFLLCASVNVYKTYCNILYSPMAKSLGSYFCNSAFIIYHFASGNDFISEGQRKYFYFFINLILSVFIDILGLIYNEFFVLNFWDLSNETHLIISDRAETQEMVSIKDEDDDDE